MLTNQYKRVPVGQIKVNRDSRHRRTINTTGLRESIAQRGVINPIIIDENYELIAGERRLTATKELGLPDIPVRFVKDLSDIERQIIELEENVKRTDLNWSEQTKAIVHIHSLYSIENGTWSQADTAKALGLSEGQVSMMLNVGRQVMSGNSQIASAPTARAAHNTLKRAETRQHAAIMQELVDSLAPPVPKEAPESILHGNFFEWAAAYSGPSFNFIHCDFPYGLNIHDSDQGRSEAWGAYDDQPELYWELLSCLATHQNKFMSASAHMMFWFSIQHYRETLDFFRQRLSDWEVNPFPLFWHKTDNKGILPDVKRGPRRVYETALLATRGDRFIVKPVGNAYGAPSSKQIHQSEKPEPVLRHFLTLFIDEHSRVLDPTCGSGTALRAAESLGAQFVFGIEREQRYAEAAQIELRRFRSLREASKQ